MDSADPRSQRVLNKYPRIRHETPPHELFVREALRAPKTIKALVLGYPTELDAKTLRYHSLSLCGIEKASWH